MHNIDPRDMARYWRGLPHQEHAISAAISSLPIEIRGEMFDLVVKALESQQRDKVIGLWRAQEYPPVVLLVASFEGYASRAYLCPSGVWTIGFGRTQGVRQGDVSSLDKEILWLLHYLRDTSRWISVSYPLIKEEHKIAALSSFIFNIGRSAFLKSTLSRMLLAGREVEAISEFSRWVYGADKRSPLPGLVHRREVEATLFATGWGAKKIQDQLEIGRRLMGINA